MAKGTVIGVGAAPWVLTVPLYQLGWLCAQKSSLALVPPRGRMEEKLSPRGAWPEHLTVNEPTHSLTW